MPYDFQIRAVDNGTPPNYSAFSASSSIQTPVDVIPPAQPAAPKADSSLLAIQITHTMGANSGGTYNLAPDLDHLEVHCAYEPNFTPTTASLVGKLKANNGMMLAQTPAVDTFPTALVSGSPILNANPTFDSGITGWTVAGGTMVASPLRPYAGTQSAQLTPDGVSSQCFLLSTVTSPVTGGLQYISEGWVWCTQDTPVITAFINWYDKTATYISTSEIGTSISANTWTQLSQLYTAPANAVAGQCGISMLGTPPVTNVFYVDNVKLKAATANNQPGVYVKVIACDEAGNKSNPSPATLSVPDLVDDQHITSLTVSKITAGEIRADLLVGARIKTADAGARVELNSAGVQAYDMDNNQTVAINDADGSATFNLTGAGGFTLNENGVAKFHVGTDQTLIRDAANNVLISDDVVAGWGFTQPNLSVPLYPQESTGPFFAFNAGVSNINITLYQGVAPANNPRINYNYLVSLSTGVFASCAYALTATVGATTYVLDNPTLSGSSFQSSSRVGSFVFPTDIFGQAVTYKLIINFSNNGNGGTEYGLQPYSLYGSGA